MKYERSNNEGQSWEVIDLGVVTANLELHFRSVFDRIKIKDELTDGKVVRIGFQLYRINH